MAAEISKPDFSYQWSSGGSIVAPSNVKIQTGWTAEVPPFQWENWSQNRQDNAILHLFQKGISEWDAASNYYFTASGVRSYVQGSDGNIYVAIQDSVGQNPTTDTTNTYWAKVLGSGFTATQAVFATAGSFSFTVPKNVYRVFARVVGGGGGAGGSAAAKSGGGGGAGGYSEGWVDVVPGASLAVVVGAGGAGGTAGNVGTSGGSSSFAGIIAATGGAFGDAGGGGTGAGGFGGIGSGGSVNTVGGDGSDGTTSGAVGAGAGGGNGVLGGGTRSGGTGRNALSIGGGGAATYLLISSSGGNGFRGIVILEYMV